MGENRITRRRNVSLSALTQKSKTKQCREQQDRKSVLRVQRDAARQMCQTGIWHLLGVSELEISACEVSPFSMDRSDLS